MRQTAIRRLRELRAFSSAILGKNARARAQLNGERGAILMYHRILPEAEAKRLSVEPGMYVTPEHFEQHLSVLSKHFHVMPLAELITTLAAGKPLPQGACALTFDDGWRDNFCHAFPVLQQYQIPATIFLVVGRIGTQGAFWSDDVTRAVSRLPRNALFEIQERFQIQPASQEPHAWVAHLKQLDPARRSEICGHLRRQVKFPSERELLSWAEVEEMAKAGIDFESHGMSHALLPELSLNEKEFELAESRRLLQERNLGRANLFAYPVGLWDETCDTLLSSNGYQAAVTTQAGWVVQQSHWLRIPRLAIHDDISASRLQFARTFPACADW